MGGAVQCTSTVSSVDAADGAAPTESISPSFQGTSTMPDGAALHDDTLGVEAAVNPTMLSLMFLRSGFLDLELHLSAEGRDAQFHADRDSCRTWLIRHLYHADSTWNLVHVLTQPQRTAVSALPPSERFLPGTE